jgi:hypothetical protein
MVTLLVEVRKEEERLENMYRREKKSATHGPWMGKSGADCVVSAADFYSGKNATQLRINRAPTGVGRAPILFFFFFFVNSGAD